MSDARDAFIGRLDSFVEYPGTVPLFDALSAPEGPDHAKGVATVLVHFPAHPLARDLREWLGAQGIEADEPGPLAVLAELGIEDVRAWYDRQKRERQALERALTEARTERADALLAANGYSFMCALLFFVAIFGWAAAFHLWDFTPEGPLPGPYDPKPRAATPAPPEP